MTDAFSILITVGLFVGVVIASPVWLFQIWAFIVPGLTTREAHRDAVHRGRGAPVPRRVRAGLSHLPRAATALLSFTPVDATNILPADAYLNFVLKFILAFGLAFLLPVFLVGLNAAGVLPSRVMLRGWRPAVFLIFLFAAMMTPSPDPWSMIFLALPMVALFFAAVGVEALIEAAGEAGCGHRLAQPPGRPGLPDLTGLAGRADSLRACPAPWPSRGSAC